MHGFRIRYQCNRNLDSFASNATVHVIHKKNRSRHVILEINHPSNPGWKKNIIKNQHTFKIALINSTVHALWLMFAGQSCCHRLPDAPKDVKSM